MAKKTRITPILDEKASIAAALKIDIKPPQVPLPTAEELNAAVSQLTKTPLVAPVAEPVPAASAQSSERVAVQKNAAEKPSASKKKAQTTLTKPTKVASKPIESSAVQTTAKPKKQVTNPSTQSLKSVKTSPKSRAATPSVMTTPQRGRPVGEKQRIKFTTALEETLLIKLKKAAIDRRQTAADIIEEFIELYL